MDRLTFITTKDAVALKGKSWNYESNSYSCQVKDGIDKLNDALEKLAHYEDMEEQGKLLILPCKPGDILYETQFVNRKWEIFPFKVNYFEVMKSHGKTRIEIRFEGTEGYALCDENGNLDDGWYLTEHEAKEALEGIKNE